jgi:hypothetical protein
MMDENEDRLDALLRDAARDYNAPPVAPKAEMWERIAAARLERRKVGTPDAVLPIRRYAALPLWIGIAALLALGVAIGRLSAPASPSGTAAPPAVAGTLSAVPGRAERGAVAAQLVTAQHLGRVETFLTEFDTQPAAQDFSVQAKELLSTTRLLLDSKRLTDAGTRKLLEDLELVLVQIAALNPDDRHEELDFIADGLAQSHLRSRVSNAIPAGPPIRM